MKNVWGAILIFFVGGHELAAQEQVTELRARHSEGQTILTWKEVDPPVKEDKISIGPFVTLRDAMDASKKIRYRLYRSRKPITSVEGLEPIAEARPLTCWNAGYHRYTHEGPVLRYVVEEGQKPVPPGTGLYAHNPSEAGEAYYAVTVSINDRENKALGAENALKSPVKEGVGPGPLVLQRVEKAEQDHNNCPITLHYYVRWESPPNSNVPSRPYDYVVMVPPNPAKPAPVGISLHGLDGNLIGYSLGMLWMNFDKGAILIATNDMDTNWWTGHHEFYGTEKPLQTKEDYQKGVVRPYTQKRLVSFLDAIAKKWDVDLSRTFVQGISMGGSGGPMLAIRYPERFAWGVSWVGVHIPAKMPQQEYIGYYKMIWGNPEYGVKFEDGTPVWDYYNDADYLRKHPEKEIGFLVCGNGKNDEGIGWPQALEFFRALQETKRPHLFSWGQGGHGEQAALPMDAEGQQMSIDIRIDRSLPAFTRCSLDDNPGNGDPANGAPEGQVNKYLHWETTGTVDEPGRWEMTVALTAGAPKDACTVDLTPRRCQKFKVKAGEKLKWTNTSVGENKQIQSGEAVADKIGLVTLEKITVIKGKNRILISKG